MEAGDARHEDDEPGRSLGGILKPLFSDEWEGGE